jgi:triosephosphate isomerase (TIM)
MATRVPLIAGNWKMFKTSSEAVATAKQLVQFVADTMAVDIMIAPAFTALDRVSEVIRGSRVSLGAQNLHWESEGAFTGEVSAAMLKSAGCRYVIIGHSERRQFFGETDETVNKRLRAAIGAELIPVVCVGETEDERETAQTFSVLDKQVQMGIKGLFTKDLQTLIIAYEPVWAIGTGKTASKDQAQEVHGYIRALIERICGPDLSRSIRILYGGSVKPDNIGELMKMPDIDGALVGGASLKAESFSQIIHYK